MDSISCVTARNLEDPVRKYKPAITFLMETKNKQARIKKAGKR